jgi:iron complex outermembrane receptor protein
MLISKKIIVLLALLFSFSSGVIHAQIERARVKGIVTDSLSGSGVIAAYVILKGNEAKGTVADVDGNYILELQPGTVTLIFKQVGYAAREISFSIAPNEEKLLNIKLSPTVKSLKTFVTTAGKFEQNIEELTVSLEVLRPNIIENKNTTTMDDALQQVPGVNIVDGEPQIRSGSGYSFGAGSRVMVLLDDLPILSGDAGRPSWGFLPIENLEQVEVIKGASSVLYGSAALSGVRVWPSPHGLFRGNISRYMGSSRRGPILADA